MNVSSTHQLVTLVIPWLELEEDSHLIVVAMGEGSDLKTGYGTSDQAGMQPCAYHNPIFIDVDGDGFRANGDTLGFPLPTKKMKPELVQWIDRRINILGKLKEIGGTSEL